MHGDGGGEDFILDEGPGGNEGGPQGDQDEGGGFSETPEDATGFGGAGPATFNRKRVLMALCIGFSAVICGGLLLNMGKGGKKTGPGDAQASHAARTPTDLLASQMNRAAADREREARENAALNPGASEIPDEPPPEMHEPLPAVSWAAPTERQGQAPQPPPAYPPPQGGGGGSSAPPREPTYLISPLTPRFEGSFWGSGQPAPQPQAAQGTRQQQEADDAYLRYLMASQGQGQTAQENRQAFYEGGGGALEEGYFTAANALWTGTVIPGVLITGISTDLPGNIAARVTENIYDSRTGRNLLIPQGTVLSARYNSSVSYAQRRVQIAWDSLIRPDGWHLDLGGMAGIDRRGMAGQEARMSENWFEYLKAAGIIALFTVANSRMAGDAARYANEEVSGGIAQANAQFVSEMGGNIVSRAMNIQPTLSVESGTSINILLNRTIYLPPMEPYPVEKKYTLE